MTGDVYCYSFAPGPPAEEVEGALLLALVAAEGLHGEAKVRMEAAHYFDAERRVAVVDGGTAVGCDLNRLFVQFLRRELGDDAFTVRRSSTSPEGAGRPEGTAAGKEAP